MTTHPSYYGRTMLSLDSMFSHHHADKMHPEFRRRLRAWLASTDGQIGIGGSWRATGSQPSKPGFAPEGKSFHQYQTFASGLTAFCAVDLVARNGANIHRAPSWSEVPAQGSAEARKWGVHCNVSSEAWHMQPIEIDGHASWVANGRPDPVAGYPVAGYPLPGDIVQPTEPIDPQEDDVTPFRKRVYDSRLAGGRMKAGETRRIKVGAVNAALLNVQAILPSAAGYLEVWPSGKRNDQQSVLTYDGGDVRTCVAFTAVNDDEHVNVFSLADTDLVVEIQGVI